MFSVYYTSKWIHCAWIFSWVVQFHPSFVKFLIGLDVFMWPLSCGAYVGDAGWSLFCFVYLIFFFFLLLLLLLFSSSLYLLLFSSLPISISDLFHTTHQTKDEHSDWQIQGEGFRALPGLNIFFLLFFIFMPLYCPNLHATWPISVFCPIFSIFILQWKWFPACLDILEPAMKSEEMLQCMFGFRDILFLLQCKANLGFSKQSGKRF